MTTWTLDYLAERFGNRTVEVQSDRSRDPTYEMNSDKHKKSMTLGAYLDLIRSGPANEYYMTANNFGHNQKVLAELFDDLRAEAEDLQGYVRSAELDLAVPAEPWDVRDTVSHLMVGDEKALLAAARTHETAGLMGAEEPGESGLGGEREQQRARHAEGRGEEEMT